MTCPHCGASVYENDVKCPYCDSFLENRNRNAANTRRPVSGPGQFTMNGPDQVNAALVVVSILIPIFGIIYGAISLGGGHPKSGKVYLILGLAAIFVFPCLMFVIPLCFTLFAEIFKAFQ